MRATPPHPRSAKPVRTLHPRNRHQGRYDFVALKQSSPELADFVVLTPDGKESINFTDPLAVKALNRALLKLDYGVEHWDIPQGYLCPPIPGRADYLHTLADLLAVGNDGEIPRGKKIQVLDVGVGANCIYPLIGHAEYGWRFVGTEIDPVAMRNAQEIIKANTRFSSSIRLRQQNDPESILAGMVQDTDHFTLTLCNPPFHASAQEAAAGSNRKWQNLGRTQPGADSPLLNFGGQDFELWCPGGEEAFVKRMVMESVSLAEHCLWFSSLVAKSDCLPGILRCLKRAGAHQVETIEMSQGQKKSRLVAWSFLDPDQQREWKQLNW